ncbi:hypothetical protein SDC9_197524 [bioreactor metagenome]|uniref:Uncharacterized protein n=1 Tax=bioreactor metagenome TaxID=1076179 RepID=A0A645IFL4_9ZZZZ
MDATTDPALPRADRRTASAPEPSSKSLCPGRTASAVSASGAPKNTEGITSWKVCDIAFESIITAMYKGATPLSARTGEKATSASAKLFECIPGNSPEIMPRK